MHLKTMKHKAIISMSVIFLLITSIQVTFGQQFARPVALPNDESSMVIPVYTGPNGKHCADRHKCGSDNVDTTYYRFVAKTWYQTIKDNDGTILYGYDTLDFNGYKIDNVIVFNNNDKEPIESITELEAYLICRKNVEICGSKRDSTYDWLIYVKAGGDHEFNIVFDTFLLSDEKKYKFGDTILLSEDVVEALQLPSTISESGELSKAIQVVSIGYRGCFIKNFSVDSVPIINKVEAASIFEPLWLWIVGGVFVLVVLMFLLFWKKIKKCFSGRKKNLKESTIILGSDGKKYNSIEDLAKKIGVKSKEIEKKINKSGEYNYNKIKYKYESLSWSPNETIEDTNNVEIIVKAPEETIESLQEKLEKYEKYKKNLEDEKAQLNKQIESINSQKEQLEKIVKNLKENPKSFKDNKEFNKLSEIIEASEKVESIRKDLSDNPNLFDKNTKTGSLVAKGQLFDKVCENPSLIISTEYSQKPLAEQVRKGSLLDKAKDNVAAISQEANLKGTMLWQYVDFVNNPANILAATNSTIKMTALFKLMSGLDYLKQKSGTVIDANSLTSDVLKDKLGNIIKASNGSLLFDEYKPYWKSITTPLSTLLNNLHKHDEKYNTRALMFYTSQLYSIACVMCEASGGVPPISTGRLKQNVQLFKSGNVQVGQYGFPELDSETLQSCKFEYKGAEGEDDKVKYLKQYAPLPFILLQSYFSDDILK